MPGRAKVRVEMPNPRDVLYRKMAGRGGWAHLDLADALLSFQLKCCSNIDSIHYLGLTNSFDQVPRDIHTLPVKEPIPSI